MTTAYPLVIHVGPLPITGFGLMMMLAFFVAGLLIDRESRRLGMGSEYAGDMVVAAIVGGIVGAKLWYVALHGIDTLFERSGLVWYGGFVGGAVAVVLNGWRRRVPMAWTAHLAAVSLPAAYAVGRIGCYVVGDDYGVPTSLPWGVKFPQGAPPTTAANLRLFHVNVPASVPDTTVLAVHPTQLYEVAAMLVVFAFIWRQRRTNHGTGWLFGLYLLLAGIERFAVEMVRAKDDRHILPGSLSVAQGMSLLVAIAGIIVMVRLANKPTSPFGPWIDKNRAEASARNQTVSA